MDTEFLAAIHDGDIERVSEFVDFGFDLKIVDVHGGTLLHVAAGRGHVELFKYLAQHGLNPRAVDKYGRSVLHKACEGGRYEMVQFLASKYRELIQQTDHESMSALHYAARNDNIELIKFLFELGLDVESLTNSGKNLLHVACEFDYPGRKTFDILDFLVVNYPLLVSQGDRYGLTPLHYAAKSCSVEIFQLLVDRGSDPFAETRLGTNVLHLAAASNTLNMVEYIDSSFPRLLKKTDKNQYTALHHCAGSGRMETFVFLVEKGLDVYALARFDWTVLHIACSAGRYEAVKYLTETYPGLLTMQTKSMDTPLLLAAARKHDEVMSYLIENAPGMLDESLSVTDRIKLGWQYLNEFTATKQQCSEKNSEQENFQYELDAYSVEEDCELIYCDVCIGDKGFAAAVHRCRECCENLCLTCSAFHHNSNRNHKMLEVNGMRLAQKEDDKHSQLSTVGGDSGVTSRRSSPEPTFDADWADEDVNLLIGDELMSGSLIRSNINQSGISLKEKRALLHLLCCRAERIFPKAKEITAGYQIENPSEPVLLALVDETDVDQTTMDSFHVIFRKHGIVSTEARDVILLEQDRGLDFSVDEKAQIRKSLSQHSKTLMDRHSNLINVSASKLKSKHYGTEDATVDEQICIVLYVPVKGIIPYLEDPFPKQLDGLSVDVREGRFELYSDPCKGHDKLMMGCGIESASRKRGSLGGFVKFDENIYCLTTYHIFDRNCPAKDVHHYSNDSHGNFKFGELVKGYMLRGDETSIGVDAALIKVTDSQRSPKLGIFPDATSAIAGFTEENPMTFTTGKVVQSFDDVEKTCNVVKYGARTGHTLGILRLAGAAVRKEKFNYCTSPDDSEGHELHQQFEILHTEGQPFSNFGDSGSLVLSVSDKGEQYDIRALGILVGGTDHNTTIVTPIWAVLQTFGLPMQLMSFPDSDSGIEFQNVASDVSRLVFDSGLPKANEHEDFARDDVSNLKSDTATLKSDMDTVKSNVKSLQSDMTVVKSDVASVKQSSSSIDSKVDLILKAMELKLQVDNTPSKMEEDESL